MTKSELFAVMCGGLASVGGSVLAGYASMGVPLEYNRCIIHGSPGGLLFAKIIMPGTEKPKSNLDELEEDTGDDKPTNVIDAAASELHLALSSH